MTFPSDFIACPGWEPSINVTGVNADGWEYCVTDQPHTTDLIVVAVRMHRLCRSATVGSVDEGLAWVEGLPA